MCLKNSHKHVLLCLFCDCQLLTLSSSPSVAGDKSTVNQYFIYVTRLRHTLLSIPVRQDDKKLRWKQDHVRDHDYSLLSYTPFVCKNTLNACSCTLDTVI